VWLGMINNPNGTVGWGLSRNEWGLARICVDSTLFPLISKAQCNISFIACGKKGL